MALKFQYNKTALQNALKFQYNKTALQNLRRQLSIREKALPRESIAYFKK